MLFKSHLNPSGGAGECGAAMGEESSGPGDVLVDMARQLDLCQSALTPCGQSRGSLGQQDRIDAAVVPVHGDFGVL